MSLEIPKVMTAADIVQLIRGRHGVWRIMPANDVVVMGAETDGTQLTLWLAGPGSDESHPCDFATHLVEELEDGVVVFWSSLGVYEFPRGITYTEYKPWMLVRDDKLACIAHSS